MTRSRSTYRCSERAVWRGPRLRRYGARSRAPTSRLRTVGRPCRSARSPPWEAGSRKPFVDRQISDSLFWASTPARRLCVRVGLARAARVVALWEGAATTLQARFGVRADCMRVIPNGVVAERFAPVDTSQRVHQRRAHSLDEQTFTLVYAGCARSREGRRRASLPGASRSRGRSRIPAPRTRQVMRRCSLRVATACRQCSSRRG